MSDDRTREPSPRRLREARERGLVPSSAELTAAVGLLAAVAALGTWGNALVDGLVGVLRGSLSGEDLIVADARSFLVRVRGAVGAVSGPLLGVLAAPVLAAAAAHQVQVGGLFVPALALPDPARLRPGAVGGSPADRLGRASGAILRGVALVGLGWWAIRGLLGGLDLAADGDAGALLRAAGGALHATLFRLGLGLLAIGLAHSAIQARRVAARLRQSPEQQREEQRSQDGDPGLRARRRGTARRHLAGPTEVEAGPASPAI